MFDLENAQEILILIGVSTHNGDDTQESLDELEELLYTAGASCADKVIQNRESIHPGTYIGKGKIEEVKELLQKYQATGVVCDDELSPAQMKNLGKVLDTKVMDRTVVILDIFAKRATTKEGKIQVELAQLRHQITHLVGMRDSLSRLGGGIGTRGPGEKKLEMDRRLIRNRISQLKAELTQVKQSRDTMRELRTNSPIPVVSIVGYTNVGKSTLLNALTGADVLEEDKLFATLDPTTRNLKLPSGQELLLTDTVGFIRKLPHHLIEAFQSTLEEAKYADIILHVVDGANPNAYKQMHVVYETLKNLGVKDKPIITVFNKQDLNYDDSILKDVRADKTLKISAKNKTGLENVLNALEEILRESKIYIENVFSYQDAGKIQSIRKYGQLLEEEYQSEGIFIKAYFPKELYYKLSIGIKD